MGEPVIILGCPRSGTSVLAATLAAMTGRVNLGEVLLTWRVLPNNPVCTCSKKARDCEVWSAVYEKMNQGEFEAMAHWIDGHMSRRQVGRAVGPTWVVSAHRRLLAALGERCPNGVVDSSKLPANRSFYHNAHEVWVTRRTRHLYRSLVSRDGATRQAGRSPLEAAVSIGWYTLQNLGKGAIAPLDTPPQVWLQSLEFVDPPSWSEAFFDGEISISPGHALVANRALFTGPDLFWCGPSWT